MTTKECVFQGMECLMAMPDGFDAGKKYPVILFLHGAGTRNASLSAFTGNSYFKITAQHVGFPFVTFAPICTGECWFDHGAQLIALVKEIAAMPFVDETRFYLVGNSMGGYGTWQLAMCIPEYFAAIVPICGGGMYWDAARLVNVPVWAFHGGKDPTVFPEESQKMVNTVNKRGGNAKLTIYPENGHDAWSDTYANWEVFQWLLSHTNQNAAALVNEYKGNQEHFG